ncbi:RNA methyltransferase [Candidatus Woesearchaeota archaeon]|nr:RNA methyltransferase [Candidatus Woesearchaeota archaeon]
MIEIILMEPEREGNIGAVARVMKNFGFKKLVLINPQADHLSEDAQKRSKHASDVLKRAEVKKASALKEYDCLIATTAKVGNNYTITRQPLTPEIVAQKLKAFERKKKVGLVFGREGAGLTNKEIASCDFVMSIPASPKYPTMNLSHAVTIVLYELFIVSGKKNTLALLEGASKKDKEILYGYVLKHLERIDLSTQEKRETHKQVWKKVIGKAMLSKREAFILMGFFRKLLKK